MYAIDKLYLIHSATKNRLTTGARGSTFSTSEPLTNILIQPSAKRVTNQSGAEVVIDAVMFYDVKNSSGLVVEFAIGDKITFDGKVMYIVSVSKQYSFELHHYEIGLK